MQPEIAKILNVMKSFSKAIAAIMLTAVMCLVAGCKKDNGGNGTYKGHDYIDLGLPSGTMWATCNVGAENPEDYGDYFAWGETQPKIIYSESNYKYSHGCCNQLTKYCSQSDFGHNGFTDKLTTLESSDDAAAVNWGEGWSTPTNKQWVELLTKCSHSWTTRNGVKGCLFTGRNGNTIFLPAASSRSDEDSRSVGDDGSYWSSSLNKGFPEYAKGFKFIISFDDCDLYDDLGRCSGRSVRPVCSSH